MYKNGMVEAKKLQKAKYIMLYIENGIKSITLSFCHNTDRFSK